MEYGCIVDLGQLVLDLDLVELVALREGHVSLHVAVLGAKRVAHDGADQFAAGIGDDGDVGHAIPPP